MQRVVITGLGIYSCIGKNLEEVKQSLYHGKSGIKFDPVRKEMGFRSGLTGVLERPNLKGMLDRRMRRPRNGLTSASLAPREGPLDLLQLAGTALLARRTGPEAPPAETVFEGGDGKFGGAGASGSYRAPTT